MGKNLSNKYGQKLLNSANKSTVDTIKTAFIRAIQKTTGDLISNKIANKITSVSKKSSNELQNDETESKVSPKNVPKKRYISTQERQQIIDELRLV